MAAGFVKRGLWSLPARRPDSYREECLVCREAHQPRRCSRSHHVRKEVVMSRKKVLVLGGNFGGLTAALAVKHELHGDVDVTVVSTSDRFLFNPSLIWLPFGKRTPSDITFPLAPTFESHDVEFVHAEATALDLAGRKVDTTVGPYTYDYLVIATGYRNNFDVVPGLGPDGN